MSICILIIRLAFALKYICAEIIISIQDSHANINDINNDINNINVLYTLIKILRLTYKREILT